MSERRDQRIAHERDQSRARLTSMSSSQPATKICVLLEAGLPQWQALNVTAFLVSGLGQQEPELIGEPYVDGDGNKYLPMFRQPVMIYEGDSELLRLAHQRALSRDIPMALYTRELFSTGNDVANRAAVSGVATENLDLVGLAMHCGRNTADKVLKGARLHH